MIKLYLDYLPAEKSWDAIRDSDGNLSQFYKTAECERQIYDDYNNQTLEGYVLKDDSEYSESTPLHVSIKYKTTNPINLIGRTKCLLDALTGTAWSDDCTIASIKMIQEPSDKDSTTVWICPAKEAPMYILEGITIKQYFKPLEAHIYSNGIDITSNDKKASDDKSKALIRTAHVVQDGYVGDNASKLDICVKVHINRFWDVSMRRQCLIGEYRPIYKPDVDNMAHLISESLLGTAYSNISQLKEITVSKIYDYEDAVTWSVS